MRTPFLCNAREEEISLSEKCVRTYNLKTCFWKCISRINDINLAFAFIWVKVLLIVTCSMEEKLKAVA